MPPCATSSPSLSLLRVVAALFGAFVAAASLAACGGHRVMANRMGAVYAPKPAGCDVRFENLTHQEASASYDMIGLVTAYDLDSDELTEDVRRDVQREACKLGADIVTLNAGAPNLLQFSAWHAR